MVCPWNFLASDSDRDAQRMQAARHAWKFILVPAGSNQKLPERSGIQRPFSAMNSRTAVPVLHVCTRRGHLRWSRLTHQPVSYSMPCQVAHPRRPGGQRRPGGCNLHPCPVAPVQNHDQTRMRMRNGSSLGLCLCVTVATGRSRSRVGNPAPRRNGFVDRSRSSLSLIFN